MEPVVNVFNEQAVAQQPQYRLHLPGQRNGQEILIDVVGRWVWSRTEINR